MKRLEENSIYIINTQAIGDNIAAIPVVKYIIENVHLNSECFIFVHSLLLELYKRSNLDMSKIFPIEEINQIVQKEILLPKKKFLQKTYYNYSETGATLEHSFRVRLGEYTSWQFMMKILNLDQLKYIKLNLKDVDVSKFKLPNKYFCVTPVYTSKNKKFEESEYKLLIEYLNNKGILPVILGNNKNHILYKLDINVEGHNCIDLVNKTTITETAKIIDGAEGIFGLDNGLVHLAGCTNVKKIISGYTFTQPILKMPICDNQVYTVEPDNCKFCMSDWFADGWNFAKCYNNDSFSCAKEITAEKVIKFI